MSTALIGCSGPKLDHPAPARELYTGDVFRKRVHYAEPRYDRWFIISTLYGLVEPDQVIAPYDLPLRSLPPTHRRAWARTVVKQLAELGVDEPVTILAGNPPRQLLEQLLDVTPHPSNGMRLGPTLRWFLDNDHE